MGMLLDTNYYIFNKVKSNGNFLVRRTKSLWSAMGLAQNHLTMMLKEMPQRTGTWQLWQIDKVGMLSYSLLKYFSINNFLKMWCVSLKQIYSKFLVKSPGHFIENTLQNGYSLINCLHIYKTSFWKTLFETASVSPYLTCNEIVV